MPRLIIKGRNAPERVFNLDKDVITIGKDDPETGIQNTINLDDKTASRRHARITREGEDYFIEDLKSTNHTFVNGKEIKKVKLKHGDRITIGFSTLVFETEGIKFVNPSDLVIKFQELDRSKPLDLNYFILHQVSERLVTATNLEEFLKSIADLVRLSVKTEKCLLFLLGDDGELHCRAVSGPNNSYSKSSVERVRHEKRSMISSLEFEPTDTLKTLMFQGIQSVMCAPILKYGDVVGVIYVEDPKPGRFGESDLILLTTIANHISWNIEKVIWNEKRKKEGIVRSNLARFIPLHLIDKMIRDSVDPGEIRLKTERIPVTILVSDIHGFALLIEKLNPFEITEVLNEYYTLMTEVIFKYEGTLIKYDGGVVVGVFGTPVPFPDGTKNAVLAAIEMQDRQRAIKEKQDPRKKLDLKIGINTGEVVAGYMGSPVRMEYTILGEAVILTHRLASLAEPGSILVSKQINDLVKLDYITKFMGKMKTPKGDEKMEVYSVLSKVL
jgi:adenylate cyclase